MVRSSKIKHKFYAELVSRCNVTSIKPTLDSGIVEYKRTRQFIVDLEFALIGLDNIKEKRHTPAKSLNINVKENKIACKTKKLLNKIM